MLGVKTPAKVPSVPVETSPLGLSVLIASSTLAMDKSGFQHLARWKIVEF